MNYSKYSCLSIEVSRGVAFVTINHPPINLFGMELLQDLLDFGAEVKDDPEIKVIVFQSANPDFFIAHADVALIGTMPVLSEKEIETLDLGPFQELIVLYRHMPKVTIGKIEGCARGGGNELLMAMDMRFAAEEKAVFSQPEVALGIIPGAGGSQSLARLVGRAKALEILLGCDEIDAATAEKYGFINRAMPQQELTPFVEKLAYRIAAFPAYAIERQKQAVTLVEKPYREVMVDEWKLFNEILGEEETRELMQLFLDSGGQTEAFEKEMTKNWFAALDKRNASQ